MASYRYEQLVVDTTTAQGITHRVGMDAARRVHLTISGNRIRYRVDGGLPTASLGHLVAVDSTFTLDGADAIQRLRMIAVTGTAEVSVTIEGP